MILLPLSGGIDSVAALWHLRDRDLRVFHLVMGYHWRRVEAELHATRQAIRWMEEGGHFTGRWRYTEIDLLRTSPWAMAIDIPAVGFWVGAIARLEPDIESICRVIIGDGSGNSQDTPDVKASFEIAEAVADRPLRWEFPFENTPKAELHAATPRELMDHAISCWGPIPDAGRWRQCGHCEKCEECRQCGVPIE